MSNGHKHRARCHPQRWHHAKGLCRPCYGKKWDREHPRGYGKSQQRGNLTKLGWTIEAKEDTAARQKGLCAICAEVMNPAHADHEHTKPPKPRGLLCRNCNSGLGFFKDSRKVLAEAINYLHRWGT